MASILKSVSNLVGALVALAVAVVGFFGQVGPVTLALRSLVAGVVVGLLARLLGALFLFAVTARYVRSSKDDDASRELRSSRSVSGATAAKRE